MNLPEAFESRMRQQLGSDYELFVQSLEQPAPVSVRINPGKWSFEKPNLERVEWCANGYYLPNRPVFSSDPLWHAGAYYVQEASSMAIECAFNQIKKHFNDAKHILDLCAAPGGKSTLIAGLMDEGDVLVCNEVIRSRVAVLTENIIKQGAPNTIITHADSEDFARCGPVFDLILVDAPCSGEGLFRKDPDAVNEWSADNVLTCELRQKRILDNTILALKPEGFLIYSTCTYNPGENIKQIDYLIESGFELIEIEINGESRTSWQFMPHTSKGEGFFMAVLKKNSDQVHHGHLKFKQVFKPLKPDDSFNRYTQLNAPVIQIQKALYAVPQHVLDFYHESIHSIRLAYIGQSLGELNDKLFQVSEFLPFSQVYNPNVFETHDLDFNESLSYLSNNALPWGNRSSKGYVLLTFKKIPIGLGKFAGNRINNLFPNSWKLRKMPEPASFFTLVP